MDGPPPNRFPCPSQTSITLWPRLLLHTPCTVGGDGGEGVGGEEGGEEEGLGPEAQVVITGW